MIYCFVVRDWKGNFSPGSEGKFWIEKEETGENVHVRQFPSPLVDAEQQAKLLHSHLVKTGATVSASAIKSMVIFTNPDLSLPAEVEANSRQGSENKLQGASYKAENSVSFKGRLVAYKAANPSI